MASIGDLLIPAESRDILDSKGVSAFDIVIPGQTIDVGKVNVSTGTLTEDITVNLKNQVSSVEKTIIIKAGHPVRLAIHIPITATSVGFIEAAKEGGRRRTYRRKRRQTRFRTKH